MTAEREALHTPESDIWDQLTWQGRQLWRRGCAMNDPVMMMKGTDVLLKVANRKDPGEKAEKPAPKGRGAPTIETPEPATEEGATGADFMAERLLQR